MKTVLLLRHAKSAWGSADLADHERPLNRRGERAARAMAQYLAEHCPWPDFILCSTAVRTRQTLAPLLKLLEASTPTVALENGLYLASDGALLARLRALPGDVGTVLLIGHNEGIGLLAAALAGSGPPDLLRAVHEKYPTGALAVLRAPIDRWQELAAGAAELQAFVRPRDLVDA